MFRILPRTLLKAGLLPTALLMAVGGSPAAFASQAAATANVTSDTHAARSRTATTQCGSAPRRSRSGQVTTRITVSFRARRSVRHTGGPERQRPAGWRHGVVLAVHSRHRRPFGPDLDRRNLDPAARSRPPSPR